MAALLSAEVPGQGAEHCLERGEVEREPLAAAEMIDILEQARHGKKSEWQFFRELKVGTGGRNSSAQRLDAFALNCLTHQSMKRICYELKMSRADFLCELQHPLKRRIGMRYSNEFYFVCPGGLLRETEIPVDCGLIEIGRASFEEWRTLVKRQAGFFWFDGEGEVYCMMTVPACWRDTPGPTWQFAAAMLRNQQRSFLEKPPTPPQQQKLELVAGISLS